MNSRYRRCLALGLLLPLLGCSVGTRLFAGHEDYRLYRETRLAGTLEARLAASHQYLETMPEGQWRDEVKAWFRRSEPAYYKAAQNSLPRLRAYLDAMPDGPHAKQVASRIVELESEIGFARRRDERTLSSARKVQSDLVKAAEQRQALVRSFSDWLRLLSNIDSWGQPTSELESELIYRFRLLPPAGKCEGVSCKKSLSAEYAIPEQGKLEARVALYDIELGLDGGGVVRASVSGPELFSRLGEAMQLQAVGLARPQTRLEAIGLVIPIFENVFEAKLPQARCERAPTSPVIFERACDGRHVTALAGSGGDDPDKIVIEPLSEGSAE